MQQAVGTRSGALGDQVHFVPAAEHGAVGEGSGTRCRRFQLEAPADPPEAGRPGVDSGKLTPVGAADDDRALGESNRCAPTLEVAEVDADLVGIDLAVGGGRPRGGVAVVMIEYLGNAPPLFGIAVGAVLAEAAAVAPAATGDLDRRLPGVSGGR